VSHTVSGTDTSAAASATYWNELANRLVERAGYEREIGLGPPLGTSSPLDNQAESYRRCAWALAQEADTGQHHCSGCFTPQPPHLPCSNCARPLARR
jgi:hypothetical protein